MIREETAEFISQFSIYQYAFIKPEEAFFSDKTVKECRKCANYRTSWSCPPAIVSFSRCKRECLSYEDVFVFSCLSDRKTEKDAKLSAQFVREHARITDFTSEFFRSRGVETYVLTSDRCMICEKCTFPKSACRHPDRMHPCIESHGIKMSDLLARCDMDSFFEEGYTVRFSLIFIKRVKDV